MHGFASLNGWVFLFWIYFGFNLDPFLQILNAVSVYIGIKNAVILLLLQAVLRNRVCEMSFLFIQIADILIFMPSYFFSFFFGL